MGVILGIYLALLVLIFVFMLLMDIGSLRRSRQKEYLPSRSFRPMVLVIIPCRGMDLDLAENLESIKSQDYANYKVVAVVDSPEDPASRPIKGCKIPMLISGYRPGKESGKVKAIITAIEANRAFDAYVIADSDIHVGREWLADLIAPLQDKTVGISTMYPKFLPKGGFWSRVKYLWGFVGEGLMESDATRFGWGGSLAFRKGLLGSDPARTLSTSRYAISDDISLTKLAQSKGLSIAYSSRSQPAVYSNDDFGKFIEWSNRQTALSILGYRRNLYYGTVYYSSEIILLLSGIWLSVTISPLFLLLFVHLAKSEWKIYKRSNGFDLLNVIMTPFMPFFYLGNLIVASRLKSITWRGRLYSMR